ncbi:unnamed protein product [Pieris brassicae]|uniref:RdRp catalytic domain-containing protein n=1 Tax=Pieris brassicae TaxID=7116 RepID=A0A9P0TEP9_PIEBR|nr:unnamed protein product [Pieris brassicae]
MGDRILAHHGNAGYKAIKLIEPISTVRISELASVQRPQIPEFPDFKEHVLASITEPARESPGLTELSREILRINSVDLAFTVANGSGEMTRLWVHRLEGSLQRRLVIHSE